MSEQGAVLQTYNNELVKHIENMKAKRDNLWNLVVKEETIQRNLETEIDSLQEQVDKIKDSVSKNLSLKEEYDRVITTYETAYTKVDVSPFQILESSQVLLSLIKKESTTLTEKSGTTE